MRFSKKDFFYRSVFDIDSGPSLEATLTYVATYRVHMEKNKRFLFQFWVQNRIKSNQTLHVPGFWQESKRVGVITTKMQCLRYLFLLSEIKIKLKKLRFENVISFKVIFPTLLLYFEHVNAVLVVRLLNGHLKGQVVSHESINETTRIKASSRHSIVRSRAMASEQWQAIVIGNCHLQGKHTLVFTLINSLCILHTSIRLSGDPVIHECRGLHGTKLPRISTFTVSESLLRMLELRPKVLAPNQLHPLGVNWFL